MKSENYRQLLNNEFKDKEMTLADFDNTLMHFAMLYRKELLSDLIDFSNNNAPPVIQKGLKQVILEFNKSLNCD